MSTPGAWEGVRAPPPTPECGPDEHTGPPDFVGVGVQRCGTTRWFDLVTAHPAVAVPRGIRKELHFFDQFHLGGFSTEQIGAYHAHFPRSPNRITGEWTPTYMSDVHTPRLLAAAAPDTRLLVLLRDPVERYRSAIRRQQRVSAREGLALHSLAPSDAFARGLYHGQLERLTRHFDRSRILLLQFERCAAEPAAELRRTLCFLGLSNREHRPDLGHWPNLQTRKPELAREVGEDLVEAYRADVDALASDWPELDLRLWPNFSFLA